MFEVEYCNNPELGDIHSTGIKYNYAFDVEFDAKLKDLDKFLFLVDMHTIIDSCGDDLLSINIGDSDEFWKINKRLLNFVNAVYGYKEYVNSYEPSLKSITEKYYNMRKWYRFICDFRNYIIHQSIIIKDYRPFDGDVFINIEEVARLLSEYEYTKDWQRQNAKEFTEWIETFKEDSLEIKDNHFLSMKNVTSLVMKEMSQIKDEVLMFAYEKSIKPSLVWLLEQIPKIDGIFQYAFIVDKANLPESVREPNYALEDFVRRMIKTLGDDSIICKELLNLLEREGYSLFYNGNCGIKDFIKNARISK